MVRLLVVDDHPIVREGLIAVLEDQSDFEVIGAAGSAEAALALAGSLKPDLVLLDLEMPGMDGVEAIGGLMERAPESRVLIFTAYDNDEHVFGAVRAGARGYLLKGASAEEIARAIRVVHGGGSYLEPRVAEKVLREFGAPGRSKERLSRREHEVLRLVAEGLANKQIAARLGITERTVKFHVTSILIKLGADNRAQAVALAAQQRLL